MLLFTILCLSLALASPQGDWPLGPLGAAAREAGSPSSGPPEEPGLRSGLREEELDSLRARDARVSFSSDAARRARVVLEDGTEEVEVRSVALIALGCGQSEADLPLIESELETGTLPEKRAAVLAIGEFGAAGMPALERVLGGDTSGIEEAACFALLLAEGAGAADAAERLRSLSAGEASLARRARFVLAHRSGLTPEELHGTLAFYFELRWRAARSYGFVDGLRGPRAFAAELFRNEEFLDRVVLASAGELSSHELEAHLSEILAGEERIGALRVAVVVRPESLLEALEAGRWKPSLQAWQALLGEIDEKRLEGRCQELLKSAYREAPELESQAGMLLYRGGADLPWSWVRERLETGPIPSRRAQMEACGERGEKQRIPELAEILERAEDLGIDGEALIALVRLGHPPAQSRLRELLGAPTSLARDRAVAALARVLHDNALGPYADLALKRADLTRSQHFELVVGRARGGGLVDFADLRAALAEARGHATRMACVSALAADPGPENLAAMAALFPVVDDLDLDVELALALLRARHPGAHGLLRSALWSPSWNRSVLAGGLIVRDAGVRGLMDELELAPRTASERDVRRVGFALGEWGGLGAVEELSRTRNEGDPALQGALLGALSGRAGEEVIVRKRPPVKFDLNALTLGPAAGKGKGGAKGGAKKAAPKGGSGKKGKRRKL